MSLEPTGAWPSYCAATVPCSTDIEFCTHVHIYFGPHHQLSTATPVHLPGHPTIGPWGCYVHCQNGHGGLCLSLLIEVLLHAFLLQHQCQTCTKPCRAGLPFFHPLLSLDDSLLPGLGTFTQPSVFEGKHTFLSNFIDNVDFCACAHNTWSPPPTQGCHHPP